VEYENIIKPEGIIPAKMIQIAEDISATSPLIIPTNR